MANRHLPYLKTPIIHKGWIALGVVAGLVGGASCYYFLQSPGAVGVHNSAFFRCLAITALTAGLCFICGTAQWWLKK